MNYEIVGKLIFKEETQHISDRFQKREFVIEVENILKYISISGAENGKIKDKYLILPISKAGGLKK